MQIRPLTEAEMTSASQLVRQVLGEHVEATYPEEAKSAFYAFIEPENLNRMRAENEAILIGCGDEMGLHACGLIRSGGHIGFLAVEPGFQRQGLGKQLLHVLCTACFEQYSVTRITVNADPEVQAFYLACGFECRGDMQTESGVSFLPMEKMFSTTDVVSAKKHTGLIAALVGGSILILLILIGLVIFAGKKVSTYMDDRKEASEVVWEEDEEEFRTPEDAGEDGDMSDTDENDTEAGNPEEESENEWENGPRDYVTILDEDMKDVEVYVEEGIPYRLKEEVYALDEYSGEIHLEFNVHYPQINNLPPETAAAVNQELRDTAMLMADGLYLEPTEDMEQMLEEQNATYCASEVGYKITYLSEELISVVYADYYFLGSAMAEYADLRTVIVNLKTGEAIKPEDTYKADEAMGKAFHDRLLKQQPENEAFLELGDEVFTRALQGEVVDGRYMTGMVLTKTGVLLPFTYHFRSADGNIISRGWDDVEFTKEEFMMYEKEHEMWKLVESDN